MLHYTRLEILWDCRTKCLCECGSIAEDEPESVGTLHRPPDQETGMSLMGAYNRAMGRIEKLQAITTSSLSNPEEIEESTHDLQDEAQRAPKLFHQQADLSTSLATRSLRACKTSVRGRPQDIPRRLVVDRPLPPGGLELDPGGGGGSTTIHLQLHSVTL
jgi:hypothetical protein